MTDWFLFVISQMLFWISVWQIDHLCSHFLWRHEHEEIEVVYLPKIGPVKMKVGAFYCVLFKVLGLSYLLMTICQTWYVVDAMA